MAIDWDRTIAVVEKTDDWGRAITVSDEGTVNIICGKEILYLSTGGGTDGRGIVSITKTGSSGNVDTYTILYTDGTTSTFDVTNGAGSWGQITGDISDQEDLQGIIAPVFDPESEYEVGDYVLYNDALYKFTTNHTGAWSASDADEVMITDELGHGSGVDAPKIYETDAVPFSRKQFNNVVSVSGRSVFDIYQYHRVKYPSSAVSLLTEGGFVIQYPVTRNSVSGSSVQNYYEFLPLKKFRFLSEAGYNRLTTVVKNDNYRWDYLTLTKNYSDKSFSISMSGGAVPVEFDEALTYHLFLDKGSYELTGAVKSLSSTCVQLRVRRFFNGNSSTVIATDTGDGATFSLNEESYVEILVDLKMLSLSSWPWNTPIKPMLTYAGKNPGWYIDPSGIDSEIDLTSALPGGLYGGEYDVATGKIIVRYGRIASYNGEYLPAEWYSSNRDDRYQSGNPPTIGSEVIYKLAEPYKIQGPLVGVEGEDKVYWYSKLYQPGDYLACAILLSGTGKNQQAFFQSQKFFRTDVEGYTYSKFDADRRFVNQASIADEFDPEGNYTDGDHVMKNNLLVKLAIGPFPTQPFEKIVSAEDGSGEAKAGDYIAYDGNLYTLTAPEATICEWSCDSAADAYSYLNNHLVWSVSAPNLEATGSAEAGDYVKFDLNVYIFNRHVEWSAASDYLAFNSLNSQGYIEACTVTPLAASGSLTAGDKNMLSYNRNNQLIYLTYQGRADFLWTFPSASDVYDFLSDYMEQVTDPISEYDQNQAYEKGDIVIYDGDYYVCLFVGKYYDSIQTTVEEMVSESEARTQSKLDRKADNVLIADEFDPTVRYSVGDIVIKDGKLFRITGITGELPYPFVILNVPEITASVSAHKGDYYKYTRNGTVKLYRIQEDVNWSRDSAGLTISDLVYYNYAIEMSYAEYDSTATYTEGQHVIYDGDYYRYDSDAIPEYVYEEVTVEDLLDEKLGDAPSDGSEYVRKNGTWAVSSGGGGGGSTDWDDITNKPSTFPPSAHTHDDRYYTETEVDGLLADKADASDVYDKNDIDSALADKADADDVYTKTETDALLADKADTADLGDLATQDTVDWTSDITNIPSAFPPSSHTHDDRYYTESETDALLADKADAADLGDLAYEDNIDYSDVENTPTLGTMAAVNDAPSDGDEYVRKNGAWSVASGGKALHISMAATSSLGTISNAAITTTMRVVNVVWGTPSNVSTDVTWNTDTAGQLVLSGTLLGATTAEIDLIDFG